MKKILLLLILSTIFVRYSDAQTGETELYELYERTDKELSDVYNKLKKKLNKADRLALIKAQRDWIKYRDSNCNFQSQKESEGGVISNKRYINCQTYTTTQRIVELRGILKEGF
jgi:uncharacterized protein YecT (DUF1311 family)